jgi:hypothetical protein
VRRDDTTGSARPGAEPGGQVVAAVSGPVSPELSGVARAGRLVLAAAADPRLASLRTGDPHAWRDAAIVTAVDDALHRGDDAGVRALAAGFGTLLRSVPGEGSGVLELVGVGIAERRRRGAFATPGSLAAVLAAHALPGPIPSGAVPPSIVDPACGSGALLVAGFERLLALGVPAPAAFAALHGVDADPAAVAVCRAALVVRARQAGLEPALEDVARRVVVGDALTGPTPYRPGEGLAWDEAFPAVLAVPDAPAEPVTGWRGGFGAVLANPPWERLKVIGKDWAGAPPPSLRRDRAAGARTLRDAGRHPLTGAGELNAYLPFVETCWRLLAPDGRAGIVVPAGIASDRSSSALLRALLDTGALEDLHLLDPPEPLFDGVSRRVGVAVVVLGAGPHRPRPERVARVCVGVADPVRVPVERAWPLDGDTLQLVNPNSTTAPLFGGVRDAEIVTTVHRRRPVLVRRDPAGAVLDTPWQLRLVTPLHMTRDARHFRPRPGPGLLPLWEAKHAGLLDHRGGGTAAHRYWVAEDVVRDRFGDLVGRGWLAGYRNVTTADSPRTLLPTALPVAGVGNSLPLLSAPRLPLLLAALASLPVDYLVRQKHAGANLNFFKLEQVPLPPPSAYDVPAPWDPTRTIAGWVLDRLVTAHAWDADLAGLATELGLPGVPVVTAQERAHARADLDAVHALLVGMSRADLEHVLGTFGALAARERRALGRYVTAERALAAYDRLAITFS